MEALERLLSSKNSNCGINRGILNTLKGLSLYHKRFNFGASIQAHLLEYHVLTKKLGLDHTYR
ncbi:hypothetical protein B0H67DRAFT_353260 [Lasiosphaeris hirsuta]|uniref:Uncharacterized protein n=1 Tax=Lasiosphaeris hirsuta TaxID=260670 RepID=A0AA40DIB4_9PEZI|nr:hypothetical protein B0H67DRAFT_353260 [Lasiosphaeris hirsuta]